MIDGMLMNICMMALMALTSAHSLSMLGSSCAGGTVRAINTLVEPIAIAEDDTRFGMHEGGPKQGLTKAEQAWLSKATGKVLCPREEDGHPMYVGNATLMGRNDTVVTNAHVLIKDDGTPRTDAEYCVFQPSSMPSLRMRFKLEDQRTRIGFAGRKKVRDLDYAILKLEKPVPGVRPVPVLDKAGELQVGDTVSMISARALRMKPDRKVLDGEPVIQTCKVLWTVRSDSDRGGALKTSCSGTGGSSGSLVFSRDERGRLGGIGIHTAGEGPEKDGKPAGPRDEDNYSVAITFEGPLLKDLEKTSKQDNAI